MRILVADDQDRIRKKICAMLTADLDCEMCAEATNGLDAVDLTRELKPDLVILDISMPLLNGFDAARNIRSFSPETPVLFLSVHKSKHLIQEAKKVGVQGYVMKEDLTRNLPQAIEAAFQNRPFFPAES